MFVLQRQAAAVLVTHSVQTLTEASGRIQADLADLKIVNRLQRKSSLFP